MRKVIKNIKLNFVKGTIVLSGFIVCATGGFDLTRASLNEINGAQNQTEQQEQTRNTYEGLGEISLGALLLTLSNFLRGNKDKELKFYPKTIADSVKFSIIPEKSGFENTINEIDLNNKISDQFKKHKANLIYIIKNELGGDLSQAIRIENIIYQIENDRLYYKVYLLILHFSSDEDQKTFLESIMKFLEIFHDKKLEHISNELAGKINEKDFKPFDFFNGAGIPGVISSCIEQEVLDVEVGKKLIHNVDSYFSYPKTFISKVV